MPRTTHTPTGEYPEPAPVHHLDLEAEAERLLAGVDGGKQARNLAREAGVSVVLMAIDKGESMKEHSANGTATVQVLRGRVRMSSGDTTTTLTPGGLVVFQPHVRHDLDAEERSVVLLTIDGGEE